MAALAELRDLALGIHPLILTEAGLGDRPSSRSPTGHRSTVTVDVDSERFPPAVEGAAYFVISEALANVTKYAEATTAMVRVRGHDDHLSIEVEDDGIGGADPRAGSGLRGLADRVAALDGTLDGREPESVAGRGSRRRSRPSALRRPPCQPCRSRPVSHGTIERMSTILIIDDDPRFRTQARDLLEADGFVVIGQAVDGASGLEAARSLRPDFVLLDIGLPDVEGFEVAHEPSRSIGPPPLVVLTSSRDARAYGPRLTER